MYNYKRSRTWEDGDCERSVHHKERVEEEKSDVGENFGGIRANVVVQNAHDQSHYWICTQTQIHQGLKMKVFDIWIVCLMNNAIFSLCLAWWKAPFFCKSSRIGSTPRWDRVFCTSLQCSSAPSFRSAVAHPCRVTARGWRPMAQQPAAHLQFPLKKTQFKATNLKFLCTICRFWSWVFRFQQQASICPGFDFSLRTSTQLLQ